MYSKAFRNTALVSATVATLFLAHNTGQANSGSDGTNVGKKTGSFVLKDANGKEFSLAQWKEKKAIVVVFLSFECPVSTSYSPRLAELAKTFEERGVAFLGICPCEEDAERVAKQAEEFKIPFPVLADAELAAADALQAAFTPEAFVLDKDRVIRYRGRIDNSYAARLKRNPQTTRHDLKLALEEMLAGKPVSEAVTQPVGCPIPRSRKAAAAATVTFNRDIMPILQKRCQECHRPNEVAPFSLMTYKQAVKWADDMKTVTESGKMPPWKPVDSHGIFQNERLIPANEVATIARWVDGGMVEGDPKDLPPPREFREGWQLGEPDMILEPPEDMIIGPKGGDIYRVMVFPTNFPEDRYLSAFEVRPGNKRVVHHTLNLVDTTGKGRKILEAEQKRNKDPSEQDRGPGYSTMTGIGYIPIPPKILLQSGWAPGMIYRHLPDGLGYYLPKGADVVIQMHYHRTGREERDRTRIGLYFAKKPITRSHPIMAVPGIFTHIPAGAERYRVDGGYWVNQDFDIYSIMPHMHLIGKEIKATLTYPDGQKKTLIWIKDWEFNWQEFYFLKEPIHVPAGSRFDVVGYYDNSEKNPANPSKPPRTVILGEQTTNEMCFVFMGCATEKGDNLIRPWLFQPKTTVNAQR
jgi:peroxiredoxin